MTNTPDKRFFTGGNATFTVDNGKGTHYTFKIRQPKGDNKPFFIGMLTGPDNEASYTYMGIFDPVTFLIRLTAKSRYNDDTVPVKVARWTLFCIREGKSLPEGYTVKHSGRCGCCGRLLTVPESISSGLGPECRKRFGL